MGTRLKSPIRRTVRDHGRADGVLTDAHPRVIRLMARVASTGNSGMDHGARRRRQLERAVG